jgi:hypothetical protein
MRSLAAILVAIACAPAYAQVTARATIEPPVVPFHKSATLTFVVESPAGQEVTLPDVRDVLGELQVKSTPSHKQEIIGGNRVRTTEQYVLDPVHVRDYFIRPVTVTWSAGELAVPVPVFRVRELTEQEIADAGTFVSMLPGGPGVNTGLRRPLWQWGVLAVAIVLTALAAWVLVRRRRPEPETEVVKMPWDIARERLALLAARHLPQQGKFDAYYVDLSAILRYYIEGRFQLHAPERTTPEFLTETVGKGYFEAHQEVFLSRFLRLCDRVKFARFRPDFEEMSRSFDEVARFVEETVPREEPAPQEAAAA